MRCEDRIESLEAQLREVQSELADARRAAAAENTLRLETQAREERLRGLVVEATEWIAMLRGGDADRMATHLRQRLAALSDKAVADSSGSDRERRPHLGGSPGGELSVCPETDGVGERADDSRERPAPIEQGSQRWREHVARLVAVAKVTTRLRERVKVNEYRIGGFAAGRRSGWEDAIDLIEAALKGDEALLKFLTPPSKDLMQTGVAQLRTCGRDAVADWLHAVVEMMP